MKRFLQWFFVILLSFISGYAAERALFKHPPFLQVTVINKTNFDIVAILEFGGSLARSYSINLDIDPHSRREISADESNIGFMTVKIDTKNDLILHLYPLFHSEYVFVYDGNVLEELPQG